jgi:hypothetical protein
VRSLTVGLGELRDASTSIGHLIQSVKGTTRGDVVLLASFSEASRSKLSR